MEGGTETLPSFQLLVPVATIKHTEFFTCNQWAMLMAHVGARRLLGKFRQGSYGHLPVAELDSRFYVHA
jgi:hypothetical protein